MFVLKGKPLNVWDLKRDNRVEATPRRFHPTATGRRRYSSSTSRTNIEGLRYDKVILATDADVDGMHIRNLMITYFFRFFEQLVHDGVNGGRKVMQLPGKGKWIAI